MAAGSRHGRCPAGHFVTLDPGRFANSGSQSAIRELGRSRSYF